MVFVARLTVDGTFHKGLLRNIQLSQTVDYDMEDSELKGKKIVYQDHPTPKERQDNIFSMFKDDVPEEMNTEEGNKVLNLILNSSEYAEDWLRYKISKGKL